MEARAIAKYLKISPKKVRPILPSVRSLSVEEAFARLAVSSPKAARLLEKVLHSAVANLKGKGKVAENLIYIKQIMADEGPLVPPFKYRPRARGVASRIRNRTCHLTVVVAVREEAEQAKKPATKTKKKKRG